MSMGAAFAAPIDVSSVNEDNKTFVISGRIESESYPVRVLLQVLNPQYTDTDVKEIGSSDPQSVFAYVGLCETDNLGNYSFEFEPSQDKSGRYSARVSWSANEGEPIYSQNCIIYVSDSLSDELLTNINSYENAEDAENYLTDNIGFFDINSDDYLSMDDSDRMEIAEAVIGDKPYSDVEDILQSFSVAMLSDLLEKSESSEDALGFVEKYKGDAYLTVQQECSLFDEFLSREAKLAVAEIMADKAPYDKAEKLWYSFSEAIVLTAINTCSNYSGITKILEDTKDFTNLDLSQYSSLNSKNTVNEALMHKNIDSLGELADLFDMALKEALPPKKGSSSGSGSGSGSGGSSASYPALNFDKTEVDITAPTTPTDVVNSVKFADMAGYAWAENAVYSLVKKGIVNGIGANEFAPQKNITRAEFTKLIFALVGEEKLSASHGTVFDDVDKNNWYAPYVQRASELGIVTGSGNLFRPDDYITRQDAAVVIYRTLVSKISFTAKASFTDAGEIFAYAADAVAYLGGCGIINGMGDGSFSPNSTLTRAQAAVLINSALEYSLK